MIELLLGNWKEILIGILTASLTLAWNLYSGERDARKSIEIELKVKIAQAEHARQLVVARSDETIKRLDQEHKINLAKVEQNAWKNFVSRYGDPYALRLPSQSSMPRLDSADAPGGSEKTDGAVEARVAFEGFTLDCAYAAATVEEFQRWVRLNKIPVEGE